MTKEEEQAKIAEFKKAPRRVKVTVSITLVMGLVNMVRILAGAYVAHRAMGKAILASLVVFFWFFVSGSSLYARNRWGYMGLAVLSLLPILGVLAMSIRLLRLTLEGTLSVSWPETIHCSICVVQLITTVVLFRYLLAKQVRDYVWKSAAS